MLVEIIDNLNSNLNQMDINRLNKIKEICFKDNKKIQKDNSKSPLAKQFHQGKENRGNMVNYQPKQQKVDHLKKIERDVSIHYDRKQQKLEANIKQFNESVRAKRQQRAMTQTQQINPISFSPQRNDRQSFHQASKNRALSPQLRSNSPIKLIGKDQSIIQLHPSQYKKQVGSPFILRDFFDNLGNQSFCGTSQFGIQDCMLEDSEKIKKLRTLLGNLLKQAGRSQLLTPKQQQDMSLRLNGAFDKLQTIDSEQQDQRLAIITNNCINDLGQRIQAFTSSKITEQELKRVKGFLINTVEIQANLDVENVIKSLLTQLRNFKIEQGVFLMQKVNDKLYQKPLQIAFRLLKTKATVALKQMLFIKLLKDKHSSKDQYISMVRGFNSWKSILMQSQTAMESVIIHNFSNYFKECISQSQSVFQFTQATKQFIQQCCSRNQQAFSCIKADIFFKKEDQIFSYREGSGDKIQISEENSIINSYCKQLKPKLEAYDNLQAKKGFNINIDIPLVEQKTQYLKETQSLQQIIFPVYRQSKQMIGEKKLTLIFRVSIQNGEPNEKNQMKQYLLNILFKVAPLILQTYKSFFKLQKNLTTTFGKPQQILLGHNLSEKALNKLSYIQTKSLELSCLSTVSECLKLITTVIRELFSYERVSVLQYRDSEIHKLCDSTKGNSENILAFIQDKKSESEVRELVKNQIESFQQQEVLYKQKLISEESKYEIGGKTHKDIVVLSLDVIKNESMDISSIIAMTNGSQSVGPSSQGKYFVRMEKNLEKARDQVAFDQLVQDIPQILRQFNCLILFAINKTLILSGQKDIGRGNSDQDFSKLTHINSELKVKLELVKETDQFLSSLKLKNIQECFLALEDHVHQFILNKIQSAEHLKLFLCKSDDSQIAYTYIKETNNQNRNFQQQEGNLNISYLNQDTSKFQQQSPMQQNNNPQQSKHTIRLKRFSGSNDASSKVIKVRNFQVRAKSQISHLPQQMQMHHQIEDISSISGDGHTVNLMDRNSIQMNTFIVDNITPVNNHHQKKPSLTRQPSLNLFASQSSQNLQVQLNMIQRQRLRRDNSAYSELNKLPVLKITELSEMHQLSTYRGGQERQDPLLTSQIIYENTNNQEEEDIVSQINSTSKIEFTYINELNSKSLSLITLALQQRIVLNKKNVKNDKRFNSFLDNLILNDTTRTFQLENSAFIPLVCNENLIGLIQIGNCDKQACFTEQEIDMVQIIAKRLSLFLQNTLENRSLKALFKKQLNVSMLNSSLENQSVTTLLSYANKLFQSKLSSLKAVASFISKSEHYLKQAFSCSYSQIMLVDYARAEFTSFHQMQVLMRGSFDNDSIAASLVKNYVQDPVVWPMSNEFILIGDGESQNQSRSLSGGQGYSGCQNLLNQNIDVPQEARNVYPQTYLAVTVRDNESKVLAIVSVMCRNNGFKFSESDIKHLILISDHLSQVFEYISSENYLQSYSLTQVHQLTSLVSILNKHKKHYYKSFFRELLAFRYGKVNLLKNKIMRKYLDRHLQVDQVLVDKIKRLAQLKTKYDNNVKAKTMKRLKEKITQLNDRRQVNAQKCIQIFNKYDKILSIRVKDTVFRFWDQFKKSDISAINQSNIGNSFELHGLDVNQRNHNLGSKFHSTFNINYQDGSAISDSIMLNQSSILDESSITSLIYLKAKSIYKFRKVFLNKRLQVAFDTFVIKSFSGIKRLNLYLQDNKQLRLIKLREVLLKNTLAITKKALNAFQQHALRGKRKDIALKKLLNKKHGKFLTFGVKQWHQQTENSIRYDLRQEKSFNSQLTEQCRENSILQLLTTGINQVFSQRLEAFKSVEECLNSLEIKQVFANLFDYISATTLASYSYVLTFKMPQNYHLKGNYSCYIIQPCLETHENLNRTVVNQHLSYLSSINDISRTDRALVHDNFQAVPNQFNHFSSISEVAAVNTYGDFTKQDMRVLIQEAQHDSMFRSVSHARSPIIFSRLTDDLSVQASLRLRHIADQQQCLMLPMFDKSPSSGAMELLGTLEVYQKTQFESTQFFADDQARFKQFTPVIQQGLQALVSRMSLIQTAYNLQLQNDIMQMDLHLQQKSIAQTICLSQVVQGLSEQTRKTLKADHCMLIFLPESSLSKMKGTFYNFENGKLYQIDFRGTFFEQLIRIDTTQSYRQVTFPSSLVCKTSEINAFNKTQPAERFESLTGQSSFEALKYIPMSKGQILIYAEIGWKQKPIAQSMHENEHYLGKKEDLVRECVLQQVGQVSKTIQLFLYMLNPKIQSSKLKQCFQTWKSESLNRLGFTNASLRRSLHSTTPLRDPQQQHRSQSRQGTEKRKIAFAQETSPIKLQHSPSLSGLYFHGQEHQLQDPSKKHSNSQQQHSRKLSGSLVNNGKHQRQNNVEEITELEVEKAAKRKLVSAALLLIGLLHRSHRVQKLKLAFGEWSHFTESTQIAERAFNQILEVNHRHSNVRYTSAIMKLHLLTRTLPLKLGFRQLKACKPHQTKRPTVTQNRALAPVIQQPLKLNFTRGSDTQQFEDDVFTLQDLDSSLMQGLEPAHFRSDKLPSAVHTHHKRHQSSSSATRNMIIIDQNEDGTFGTDSEFSLGTGTKHMIKFKADSILEQARDNFRRNSKYQ